MSCGTEKKDKPIHGLALAIVFALLFVIGLLGTLIETFLGNGNCPALDILGAIGIWGALITILVFNYPMRTVWYGYGFFALIFVIVAGILYSDSHKETEEAAKAAQEAAAFAIVLVIMCILTLILMGVIAYEDTGMRKLLKNKKAYLFGKPFLKYILLLLALAFGVELIPGLGSLISNIRGTLISMFITTYPLALFTEFSKVRETMPHCKQA